MFNEEQKNAIHSTIREDADEFNLKERDGKFYFPFGVYRKDAEGMTAELAANTIDWIFNDWSEAKTELVDSLVTLFDSASFPDPKELFDYLREIVHPDFYLCDDE